MPEDLFKGEVFGDEDTGTAKFDGQPVVLANDSMLSIIQQRLEAKTPALAHQALYVASEAGARRAVDSGQAFAIQTVGRVMRDKMLQGFVEQTIPRGVGKVSIEPGFNYESGTGVFRVDNSFMARHYKTLVSWPVCYWFSGSIAGGLETLYGGSFVCREIECLVQGKPHCLFEVHPVSDLAREDYIKRIP